MFTLSRQQIREYARIHKDAMLFFMWASSDYAAARCCTLNGLGTGLRLASEAIEKLLKAAIWLESGSKPVAKYSQLHNPHALKEELKLHKDYCLDRFDVQLKRLNDHYLNRYHDNHTSGEGSSGDELKEIDEIWLVILETLPIPKEVFYKSYFFAKIFDDRGMIYSDRKWLVFRNEAIAPRLPLFQSEYLEFQTYYENT